MRITALETVSTAEFENILWLKVHTDEGIVGLGETFFMPLAPSRPMSTRRSRRS